MLSNYMFFFAIFRWIFAPHTLPFPSAPDMPWPMATGFGSPARTGSSTLAASTVRQLDDGWINGWIIGWLVVSTPQKKRKTSQLGWLFPIYGKKNVPNHQPKEYWLMAIDGDWWWISFLTAKSSVIGSCSTSMLVYPRVTMWINDILTCQGLPRLCAAVVCSLFDAAKVWPTTPMFQHAQFSSVFPTCGGTCLCNSSIN